MIRCVRLWTGEDRNSHFEEGVIDLAPGVRGDWLSERIGAASISLRETASGDADSTRNIRCETARTLKIDDMNAARTPMRAEGRSAGVRQADDAPRQISETCRDLGITETAKWAA